jgi:hypothetical protein
MSAPSISGDAFAGKPASEPSTTALQGEFKHTPGPWYVGNDGKGGTIFSDAVALLGTGKRLIAYLPMNEYERANSRLLAAALDFLEAAKAAVAYDAAIQSAANDPEKMSSLCTAEGEDLDALYARWISLSRAALQKAGAV